MNSPSTAAATKPDKPQRNAHPSGDARFKMLDATLKKNRFQPDALIEVLHSAQGLFGFLGDDVLQYVARALKLPPSRVYGVATFYHFFTLKPLGEHGCSICMGTACYVKGATDIVSALEQEMSIPAGKTTPDGKVSLTTARCLGACGIAPAIVYDGVVAGNQTRESAIEKVRKWMSDGKE